MPSEDSTSMKRRVPQRRRGELRVAVVLDAAAAVIEEVGYEAATMTAIALRAESSIGALYQYYRNKEEIADALRERYGQELSRQIGEFADQAPSLSIDEIVRQFANIVTAFTSKNPALLLLFSSPSTRDKDAAFRQRLVLRLAALFQSKGSKITRGEARRMALVVLQVLKGLPALTAAESPSEQRLIHKEVRSLLTVYLKSKLS